MPSCPARSAGRRRSPVTLPYDANGADAVVNNNPRRSPMQWPASTLLLATLSSALAAEPAMFRGDARHGGVYDAAGVVELHGVKWTFHTGAAVISTPAVSNGTVYVGSSDHNLYALDAASGALRWKFATGGRVTSSPAVAAERVYFASYDSKLYALDAASFFFNDTATTE